MLEIVMLAVPQFPTSTTVAGLLVPDFCGAKFTCSGDTTGHWRWVRTSGGSGFCVKSKLSRISLALASDLTLGAGFLRRKIHLQRRYYRALALGENQRRQRILREVEAVQDIVGIGVRSDSWCRISAAQNSPAAAILPGTGAG